MRIVVLALDHVYTNRIIKDLIREFDGEIKLVVESDALIYKKSRVGSLIKYIQVSGIYYVSSQITKLIIYKLLSLFYTIVAENNHGKFYSFKALAKDRQIQILKVKDINDKSVLKKLKLLGPDLIVSILFNQLLYPKALSVPKYAAINVHPAYLPDYKGISPVFWALANGESQTGVTVHFMSSAVDAGEIIKRQKVKIEKSDTEDTLYWKCAKIGSDLLISAIKEIKSKKVNKIKNAGGRYFSFPTKDSVAKFKKKNRAFFNLKEYVFS